MEWLIPEHGQLHFKITFGMWKLMEWLVQENSKSPLEITQMILTWTVQVYNETFDFKAWEFQFYGIIHSLHFHMTNLI